MDELRRLFVNASIFMVVIVSLTTAQNDAVLSNAQAASSASTVNSDNSELSKQCGLQETCGACIRTVNCAWCSVPANLDERQSHVRCMPATAEVLNSNTCRENWINPQAQETIIENKPLYSGDKTNPGRGVVQIKPQHMKLKLRPGVPYEIKFQYQQADDYPVDLYYLMDLSNSMLDDKEKLSNLGDELAIAMQSLTSNFALGFGSFVDKREMPFVNTVPSKLQSPCTGCTSPYSFKNHMSLSENVNNFSNEVKKAQVSGNIDSPEGGFDALMQAIVCTKEIGWRPNARHMLVFSTDADYHFAGDGKLAGIVEPNDEKCHMVGKEYTHGLLQDYPSVSQINNIAKEHNMNIIFAVTSSVSQTYNNLRERIAGSMSGILNQDSSNVVSFVRDQYKTLVQEVKMTYVAQQSDVLVKFKSSCLDGVETVTDTCKNIRKDIVVDFTAEITIPRCPDRERWNQQLKIKPEAVNEQLIVDIEIMCECNCENPNSSSPHYKPKAEECSRKGDLQCGVCKCDPGFLGHKCECTEAALGSQGNDQESCRADRTSDQICSGRGDCKCGQCVCHPQENKDHHVWGTFCECDDFNSCGIFQDKVCSGKDHGTCKCGVCECEPGKWKGKNCECPFSNDTCKAQPGAEDCSGRGECVCGACACKTIAGERYRGKFCEECITCKGECDLLNHCVETKKCENVVIIEVDDLKDAAIKEALAQHVNNAGEWFAPLQQTDPNGQDGDDNEGLEVSGEPNQEGESPPQPEASQNGFESVKPCSFPDQLDCTHKLRYIVAPDGKTYVFAKKECASTVNILAVVLGVIGTILIAGLLLLMTWKIATTVHDRREYAKFENERKNANWDRGSNPLYVQATSTFSNPTFGGSSARKSTVPQ